jgi:hypothetical protein
VLFFIWAVAVWICKKKTGGYDLNPGKLFIISGSGVIPPCGLTGTRMTRMLRKADFITVLRIGVVWVLLNQGRSALLQKTWVLQ